MRAIRIAAAQFEHKNGDKAYNLERIGNLAERAVSLGAEIVSFHECSMSGYTFLQHLTRDELTALAERVPDGPSTRSLERIAQSLGAVVMAGLIEVDAAGKLYNCYVAVGPEGFLAKHRKLHTFISPHLSPGNQYTVIEIRGLKAGFLTCYDNNLPENVRITTLMGAEVIFMPHVTGCLPSTMPGRGTVDRALWENRERDPVRLRLEFQGPKGRGWLMRWLPARAWENGVYAVFSNAVGLDDDTIKPGLAMILDPHGEVLAESHVLGDDVVVALLTPELLAQGSGQRYIRARRPELYGKLVEPPPPGLEPVTKPGWALAHETPRTKSH
ncbi:MAG TPA: nitrilase-related carbon-nitrogen hydrolase [Isosphaeraceae bacterium]|nr:nitrilase-related carbon-nitrogen hydrolase [Isosphaeraceae bacterium]